MGYEDRGSLLLYLLVKLPPMLGDRRGKFVAAGFNPAFETFVPLCSLWQSSFSCLSSRPHVENDIDAVALRIDDVVLRMPSGRGLALMDGSDRVDRIQRRHQKPKMPDAVRSAVAVGVDRHMHVAVGHVNAALVPARISPHHPQAQSFLVKRAKLVRIFRADRDMPDLHFVRHKLLLSDWIRRY